jgi:sugar phosphate isomerase/epimerase
VLAATVALWPWMAPTAVAAEPTAAMLLGRRAGATDGDSLRDEVLRALTARYAKAHGIAVSPAEIDAYLARVQVTLQRDRDRALARRDALTQRLAGTGLDAAERQALTGELADARRQVAAAFIRHWKIHRALYRQYGGRIIYQQGGPEPLDALRRFLEQHQAQGDLAIADAALAAAFWRYYRDETIHSFYLRGSLEEAQAFAVAPW